NIRVFRTDCVHCEPGSAFARAVKRAMVRIDCDVRLGGDGNIVAAPTAPEGVRRAVTF
ncbi:hypothetical protein MMC21_001754, partial [Puttea exsequens]|nr:hypothetical protein [Puttea exsequens]